ncbi:uncharacterized protein LOC123295992 [Chrysoperla carnea]|uniref:uncharacterized protein LOC123295992 n=1 Tax=Chrysoperla carnea TaxID=189513 RepID=UPI001D08C770|nr:uncharacterized protein LOC123295992 [Chrysoperla carnea]
MRGKFECTMVEVKSFVKFGGKLIQESNEQYLRLDKFKIEIKSFDYFGEFDPGTKNIIIHQINRLFNREDQKTIFKQNFTQQLENITEDIALKTVSPFVERVKFSEFYPDFVKK